MVMQFIQNEECPADFLIIGGGRDVFVRIRRAIPFLQTTADLEAEFRDLIRQLRCIPGYREFWIYSKKGSLRFFRVEDCGLVELGGDGLALTLDAKEDPGVKAGAGRAVTLPSGVSPTPASPTEKNLIVGMVKKEPVEGSV
jgi:hypothetical protein